MKRLLLIIMCLLIAGCYRSIRPTPYDPTLGFDPALGQDPAEVKLAEAANSVSKSLLRLEEIQMAVTPPPKNFSAPDPAEYGMQNLVSIDWSGPIEPLIEQIARSTGYRVRIIGDQPAIPIMIYINTKNVPIGDVLRDAGYQAREKADLVIFPKTKVIEMRYALT